MSESIGTDQVELQDQGLNTSKTRILVAELVAGALVTTPDYTQIVEQVLTLATFNAGFPSKLSQ